MVRIVIPKIYGCLVCVIDLDAKRCFCIRAGLSRREASGIVCGREPKITAFLYFPFMSYSTCAGINGRNITLYQPFKDET